MITTKPLGGLANRMRVLESTYNLSAECNHAVTILWEMSFELNCPFGNLFILPENSTLVEYSINPFLKRVSDRLNTYIPRLKINIPWGYDYYLLGDEALQEEKVQLAKKHRKIYIQTVHHFLASDSARLRLLPVAELQNRIMAVTANYKDYTLGIHIRRSDNYNSIKYSPTASFYNLIDQEISEKPDLSIFLATDSVHEETAMMKRYPGRVITREKSLDRNTQSGIKDALVDLFCLGNTSKIIGSYYSSFSEVAARIHGIPLVQIFQHNT